MSILNSWKRSVKLGTNPMLMYYCMRMHETNGNYYWWYWECSISIYWLIKTQSTKQYSATGLIEMCPLHTMYKLIVFLFRRIILMLLKLRRVHLHILRKYNGIRIRKRNCWKLSKANIYPIFYQTILMRIQLIFNLINF